MDKKNSSIVKPDKLVNDEYRFDSFANDNVLLNKKKNHLPAMGWNSWNAFGSSNNEELSRAMADSIVLLGLNKLGYQFIVLDDGCYLSERVDGLLANDKDKFPSGFRALADYIHEKGLKFGMYNDIGTNLCAGAAVGTCGHEYEDAKSYVDWGVDFLKVDNCYYLWDNATFSAPENAKYVFAPFISSITVSGKDSFKESFTCGNNISVSGDGIKTESIEDKTYFTNIGTFDGTGPARTPVGAESGELFVDVTIPEDGEYFISLDCICGAENEKGSWLQIALGEGEKSSLLFDDFVTDEPILVTLKKGANHLRFMNHRRQENTLASYAKLLEGLNAADPNHDIIYSMCEWGKTQPQNWAKKVGDSWRILNDITFAVGSLESYGNGEWESDYTTSVTSQYNKCVIMDEFASLTKGWNDPDMMMIGMNHMTLVQSRTHMTMWCMMNSPLMLGLDLRRVKKDDEIYKIIANKALIDLNQDKLGVQAKRIYSTLLTKNFDTTYVTNNDRIDVLAKPLSDGGVALSFINLCKEDKNVAVSVKVTDIVAAIGQKMVDSNAFEEAKSYEVQNLWTFEKETVNNDTFTVKSLKGCDNVTIKIVPTR